MSPLEAVECNCDVLGDGSLLYSSSGGVNSSVCNVDVCLKRQDRVKFLLQARGSI